MKIYVTGFRPQPEHEEALKSGKAIPGDTHDVSYNVEPRWTFPRKELAESELKILQDMWVHVDDHYCQLQVEQVGDEEFAIVCTDHPRRSPE